MVRGFFAGAIVGTLVSGAALAALSVISGPMSAPAPESTSVEVPAGSGFSSARQDGQVRLPAPEQAPEAPAMPGMAVPAPESLDRIDEGDTASASRPRTDQLETVMAMPEGEGQSPEMRSHADDPVGPAGQGAAPESPESDADFSISTDPVQPELPHVEEESFIPGMPPAPPAVVDSQTPDTAAQGVETPLPGAEDAAPQVIALPAAQTPATQSGDDAPAAASLPPLARYAADFEAAPGTPLLAVVLLDVGDPGVTPEDLAAIPLPLSIAIPSGSPNAAERSALFYGMGHEVLAMVDIPVSGAESDLAAGLRKIPQAVAVLEAPGSDWTGSRAVSETLAQALQESGHGLVLNPATGKTAQQLIAREGVPVLSVFRDFDGQDQSATVISRFMNHAANKAIRLESGVIMMGRLQMDTVKALLNWALHDRTGQIIMAPVSAALRRN